MWVAAVVWVVNLTVTGQVRDAVSREPVEGVTVQALGSGVGTITASDGRYRLELPGERRLRFARLGYVTTEVTVRTDSIVDILLAPATRALEGVTVTALRGNVSPGGVPITQHVVEKEDLEKRYSGQEMPLLLTTTPSVTSYADAGSYSNYTYLRLRGIDQTRINVTLDGVPLTDAEDQAVYFSNFPDFGNSIQSAQIQRGVGTSSYGTASYAGSINFQSIALTRAVQGGEVQFSRGSFDTYRASAEWQTRPSDAGLVAYARLSSQQTDGYRYHSGNRSAGGLASVAYFGTVSSLKVTALSGVSRNQEAYVASPSDEIDRDPRHNPLSEEERDRFTHTLISLSGTRLVGPSASLAATLYSVAAGGDYDVAIAPELWNFNLKSRVTGGFVTWNQQRGPVVLSAGAHLNGYYRDHWLHIRPDLQAEVYRNRGEKDDASAFAKVSYEKGRLTLFGDVQGRTARFRYIPDDEAGISSSSIRWNFVNPKVGASYRWRPNTAFYASVGQTGREPTRNDMFAGFDNVDTTNAAFVGGLDRVHPERVRDLEAGATVLRPDLTLNANVFSMDFRNEITPIGALSYIGLPLRKNVGSSYRRGLELDAVYRGFRRLTLGGNATLSWNRIRQYTDDASGITYSDVEPLLTPRFISNQSAELALSPQVSLFVDGRYISRSYLANTSDARFVTPSAYATDLAVDWRIGTVSLLAQARNIGNARVFTGGYTDGQSSSYYILAARNLIVTARVGF